MIEVDQYKTLSVLATRGRTAIFAVQLSFYVTWTGLWSLLVYWRHLVFIRSTNLTRQLSFIVQKNAVSECAITAKQLRLRSCFMWIFIV